MTLLRNRRRRALSIGGALAAASLALTACGGPDGDPATADNSGPAKVTSDEHCC